MTLGEFRDLTATLDDETEIQVASSLDESLGNTMDVSEVCTPDFYIDPLEETKQPIIVLLYNPETTI